MRVLEVHTVPVWEEPDGRRTFGLKPRTPHPPVVGWSNVARIVVHGAPRWFVLVHEA